MNRYLKQTILIAFAGFLISGAANAATTTTTIDVTANVAGSCTVSADSIAFGDVVAFATHVAPGSVTVNCSNGVNYSVGMDAGQHFIGSGLNVRSMQNGNGDHIVYDVFRMPAATSWGDQGLAGSTFPFGTPFVGQGNGTNQVLDFEGRTGGPGTGSNIYTAGTTYSDVVNVTVEF